MILYIFKFNSNSKMESIAEETNEQNDDNFALEKSESIANIDE